MWSVRQYSTCHFEGAPILFWSVMNTWMCVLSCFSCVQLFVTPQTVTHQAPLCMEFSRQEYWSGLPCPPPGDHLNGGIKWLTHVSCIGSRVLPLGPSGHDVEKMTKYFISFEQSFCKIAPLWQTTFISRNLWAKAL